MLVCNEAITNGKVYPQVHFFYDLTHRFRTQQIILFSNEFSLPATLESTLLFFGNVFGNDCVNKRLYSACYT